MEEEIAAEQKSQELREPTLGVFSVERVGSTAPYYGGEGIQLIVIFQNVEAKPDFVFRGEL